MTGGGARAAYQVGVLRALAEILPEDVRTPFPIICGTSAGAINAAVLAMEAGDFRRGVRRLMTVWKNFRAHHVYRSDPWGAFSNSAQWIFALMTGGVFSRRAVSLLDNSPLAALLGRHLDFPAIQRAIDAGELAAFSVTCSLPARCRSFFRRCTSTASTSATARCARLPRSARRCTWERTACW